MKRVNVTCPAAIAILLLTHVACAQVRISEFMAVNQQGLLDEAGYPSDWIEIHNSSDETQDLTGWHLTDVVENRKKWTFPECELEPDQRMVIFASGHNRRDASAPLHTNFQLNQAGEYLALTRPNGDVADHYSPIYPRQRQDVSYGTQRRTSETPPFAARRTFLAYPTPEEPNTVGWVGELSPLDVSVKRGFFDEPFVLEITSPDAEVAIRFTLDGSRPNESVGQTYSEPLHIEGTTVLRCVAFKPGHSPSPIETHSYIFVADHVAESDGLPPADYPIRWGGGKSNYGMDPALIADPELRPKLIAGLNSLPSFSLVAEVDDLFSDERGIYAHAGWHGRKAERVCSIELLDPHGGQGFQIECGLRMRGGFSRKPTNPKHGFRFFFRRQYGAASLEYPMFGEDAAQSFDHFDLRCSQNYSWHNDQSSPRAAYVRDQFNRDTQIAMGHPGVRGDYYHLYINGHYWGLFNSCERPEASFGASYLGGKKEDFDVIKVLSGFTEKGFRSYEVFNTDGALDDWAKLYELASRDLSQFDNYRDLLEVKKDGTPRKGQVPLLDPVNLIDYMLIIFYGGNLDAPITQFGSNNSGNNWYGMRNRKKGSGFAFIVWDSEHTLLDVHEDRVGPFPGGNNFERSNPQWIFQRCLDSAEFRMLLADRIQLHLFNDGALTPKSVTKRLDRRIDEIELALLVEAARWANPRKPFEEGLARLDRKVSPRDVDKNQDEADQDEGDEGDQEGDEDDRQKPDKERDDDVARETRDTRPLALRKYAAWETEMQRLRDNYIPRRTEIVVQQLWRRGLFPEVPQVRLGSTKVTDKLNQVRLSSDEGEIYYTIQGPDPRKFGGERSKKAQRYSEPLRVPAGSTLRYRVWFASEWGPLYTAEIRPQGKNK